LSHQSARKAGQLGYTNVKVFDAGYPAWKKAYGAEPAAVAVQAGAEEGSIELETFSKIIKENPQSIYLVDVRDPDEYAAGHFKTAVNIPVGELEEKVAALPTDKPIVFVCSTGARSGESFYMLQDIKPELKEVYYLEAEVEYKKDGSYKIKQTQ
jgi:rhodanese-related sulfurtransferase